MLVPFPPAVVLPPDCLADLLVQIGCALRLDVDGRQPDPDRAVYGVRIGVHGRALRLAASAGDLTVACCAQTARPYPINRSVAVADGQSLLSMLWAHHGAVRVAFGPGWLRVDAGQVRTFPTQAVPGASARRTPRSRLTGAVRLTADDVDPVSAAWEQAGPGQRCDAALLLAPGALRLAALIDGRIVAQRHLAAAYGGRPCSVLVDAAALLAVLEVMNGDTMVRLGGAGQAVRFAAPDHRWLRCRLAPRNAGSSGWPLQLANAVGALPGPARRMPAPR